MARLKKGKTENVGKRDEGAVVEQGLDSLGLCCGGGVREWVAAMDFCCCCWQWPGMSEKKREGRVSGWYQAWRVFSFI